MDNWLIECVYLNRGDSIYFHACPCRKTSTWSLVGCVSRGPCPVHTRAATAEAYRTASRRGMEEGLDEPCVKGIPGPHGVRHGNREGGEKNLLIRAPGVRTLCALLDQVVGGAL